MPGERTRVRLALGALIVGVTLGCLSVNHVLGRIDRAKVTAELARAEMRLLEARIAHRDLKPDNVVDAEARAELALADKRIEVLRRVVWAMVTSGTAWTPDFKGMPSLEDTLWPSLPVRGWNLKCEPMRDTGPGALAKGSL